MRQDRIDELQQGLDTICINLREIYKRLTKGGDACLEPIDRLDPLSQGINFQVRPPNKAWRHMSKLSGGEKTLASLALLFAVHEIKPCPLYCMDEVDAALDARNVSIVSEYLMEKSSSKGCQFIVVSLREQMFKNATRMVGVFKQANELSRVICINRRQVE